jgi:MFS family permease
MVYYSTKIFADMGLSDFLSQILAAVMNTVYAAGCWALPFTIEAFGRRRIMIWSAVGCTVTMLIFVIMIALPHPTDATQWTAVVFVIFFNFFIGYGWVGVAWLYGAEVKEPSTLYTCSFLISPRLHHSNTVT